MCGIAGCVVAPGGVPDRAALGRMAVALRHRGPDDSGMEVLGNAGLVSTRLAIVDPSPAGHEPMADASGRWWLSYNGEVFNHLELRRRLGSAPRPPAGQEPMADASGRWWLSYNGEVFNHLELRRRLPGRDWRGGSDTETLVNALAEWGDDAPRRCNGFFAFAAFDSEAQRLLLVRDRFGVKPLYWARHGGTLWFASEIAALLAAGLPRRLDRDALAYALLYGWSSGAVTPVEGIQRVLPGTMLDVDLETLEVGERRWYDPADDVDRE